MQAHAHAFAGGARPLDGRGPQQHVERRLRGPVAVPAAEPVVRDRPHPRRDRREHRAALAGHQGQEVLGDQRRAGRVHREEPRHPRAVEHRQRLLRPQSVGRVQQAGGDDHPARRGQRARERGGRGDAGLVGEVDAGAHDAGRTGRGCGVVERPRARQREHRRHLAARGQRVDEGGAQPARGADHDRAARLGHRSRRVARRCPCLRDGPAPAARCAGDRCEPAVLSDHDAVSALWRRKDTAGHAGAPQGAGSDGGDPGGRVGP